MTSVVSCGLEVIQRDASRALTEYQLFAPLGKRKIWAYRWSIGRCFEYALAVSVDCGWTMKSEEKPLGPLTRALLRRFGGVDEDQDPARRRSTYGLVGGYVSVAVNVLLFALKLVIGMVTGSIALLADAIHTLSDAITSIVVILSAYAVRRPPDKEHPFGHGRAEAIAAIVIAVLLAVAGLEFGKESVFRIIDPVATNASWILITVVLATAAVKEWLSRFALSLGRASGSAALEADGWHHRSDVFATLLVVVAMVAGRYGISFLDGVMGLGVSLLLAKVAYDIASGAIDALLGAAPTDEEIQELTHLAGGVDGVRGVHDIVIHSYGDTRFISLHIETDDQRTAAELHTLAERVEDLVGGGHHGSVCVHVDPINADHPDYRRVTELMWKVVKFDPAVRSFHDLRLVQDDSGYVVHLDVNLTEDSDEDANIIIDRITMAILDGCDATDVVIQIEPHYAYQR